jgi:hypothetical protein
MDDVKVILCIKAVNQLTGDIKIGLLNNYELPQDNLFVPKSEYIAIQLCKKYTVTPSKWYTNIIPGTIIDLDNKVYLIYSIILPENTQFKNELRWFTYENLQQEIDKIDSKKQLLISRCLLN